MKWYCILEVKMVHNVWIRNRGYWLDRYWLDDSSLLHIRSRRKLTNKLFLNIILSIIILWIWRWIRGNANSIRIVLLLCTDCQSYIFRSFNTTINVSHRLYFQDIVKDIRSSVCVCVWKIFTINLCHILYGKYINDPKY